MSHYTYDSPRRGRAYGLQEQQRPVDSLGRGRPEVPAAAARGSRHGRGPATAPSSLACPPGGWCLTTLRSRGLKARPRQPQLYDAGGRWRASSRRGHSCALPRPSARRLSPWPRQAFHSQLSALRPVQSSADSGRGGAPDSSFTYRLMLITKWICGAGCGAGRRQPAPPSRPARPMSRPYV